MKAAMHGSWLNPVEKRVCGSVKVLARMWAFDIARANCMLSLPSLM